MDEVEDVIHHFLNHKIALKQLCTCVLIAILLKFMYLLIFLISYLFLELLLLLLLFKSFPLNKISSSAPD